MKHLVASAALPQTAAFADRLPWRRALAAACAASCALRAQEQEPPPELRVGALQGTITIDGRLDEPDWAGEPSTEAFRTIDPIEGATPNGRTVLRVRADSKALYLGIRCFDPTPEGIVGYAVARDADLSGEDHVKIVLGTFQDGRTGYVFAVNPRGARYDALVASRGESEDPDWDGPWEAKTAVDAEGWTAEIRLPVSMLVFAENADAWQCNVERRVQRLLEVSRWANWRRDQSITNLARTGHLVGIPRFDLGHGLAVRGALVASVGRDTRAEPSEFEAEPSADVTWRMTPQWTGVLTLNTDFSETEVDARRTNLTRFPLFFPEKRTFFLEGKDAFDFGLGLEETLLPFHSRRIGLVDGKEVPLRAGLKVLGRSGGTNIAALVTNTDNEPGVAPEASMGVMRIRQDVLAQSNVGLIGTFGDPLGRSGSWLLGVDATYQTSELFGGRNFLVGLWGIEMDREDLGGREAAYGFKIDYPNDDWDINLQHRHVDQEFDPSLGFVARTGIERWHFGVDHAIRPENGWLRRQVFESGFDYITDLDDNWVSWSVFLSPINARLESGDGVEVNVIGQGERLTEDFELGDGVVIPIGKYDWWRYRVSATGAEKRAVAGEVSWEFGDFYDGTLDQWRAEARVVTSPLLTIRATADVVRSRLPQGDFNADVFGVKLSFTFSPDLTLDSFVQYDTESDSLGTNTRLRWDWTPLSQLFLVFNYNALDPGGAFVSDGYEATVKLQHEIRF
jgi:hypothetical protein